MRWYEIIQGTVIKIQGCYFYCGQEDCSDKEIDGQKTGINRKCNMIM